MKKSLTLIDLLEEKSCLTDRGINFIQSSKKEIFLSYKDLYQRALKVLYYLQLKNVKQGDKIAFQVNDNETFLCIFWGCILGGMIPVPITVGNNDEHKYKVFNIWDVLNDSYIITDSIQLNTLKKFADKNQLNIVMEEIQQRAILIEELESLQGQGQVSGNVKPQDLALIQFSSGTTGDPKGVMLTHENLLTNINAINKAGNVTSKDSTLSWMPLTHDMGLICVHLTSISAGMNQYIMPTMLFIRRPTLWLEKAWKNKITQLYSPNFGYKYLLSRINKKITKDWNLSSVRLLVNGAEPISVDLCQQFLEEMASYKLHPNVFVPVYGLAEATVGVTTVPPGEKIQHLYLERDCLGVGDRVVELQSEESHKGISFVDLGYPLENCYVRITDEDNDPLDDNYIGYVEIKGKNVTCGYYNNEQATAKVMTPDGWLNTGDLGFMRDGRLILTGRAKEIIFVNGQNYYPHDVERVTQGVDGIELGKIVAYGINNPRNHEDEIQLFVFYRGALEKFVPTVLRLKKHIYKEMGLEVKHVIPVKNIPKTTSGKLQRQKLGKLFERGEFDSIIQELDILLERKIDYQNSDEGLDDVERILIAFGKEVLQVTHLSLRDNFLEMGGDSLKAGLFLSMIDEELGIQIPISVLFEIENIYGLAKYIKNATQAEDRPVFQITENQEYYPLSSAQKRLYMLSEIQEVGITYNLPIALSIVGELNLHKVEKVFYQLINRHETLRTSFEVIEGEWVQKISNDVKFTIDYFEQEQKLSQSELEDIIVDFVKPFDLKNTPLIRVKIVKKDVQKYYLLMDMHHIISDGTSVGIILDEFFKLYTGQGLPELKYQYRDIVAWQREHLTSLAMREQEEFWLRTLDGELPVLNLLTDEPRPVIQSFKGSKITFTINKDVTEQLKSFATKQHTTLYMMLLALYYVLLYKYTGQNDLLVGVPIAGRNNRNFATNVGMFVNTLVMRNNIESNQSFKDLLHSVKLNALKVYENQDYPFENLVQKLNIKRDMSRNPIFDTVFALQNMLLPDLNTGELAVKQYKFEKNVAKFDLTWEIQETEDGLEIDLEYCTELFKKATIKKIAKHYRSIIEKILINQEVKIGEIDLLSSQEKQQLLKDFNESAVEYKREKTIHQLIEEQVVKNPYQIAVMDRNQQLTYRELNACANQLARFLRGSGIGREDVVGIMAEHSVDLAISILATLKAGAAYLPIHPKLPQERIEYLLSNSKAKVLLTQSHLLDRVSFEFILNLNGELYQGDDTNLDHLNQSNDLAYIIYTSGSTGQPKGVMVQHYSLHNFLNTFYHLYDRQITGDDHCLCLTNISFDVNVCEIFLPLVYGATLVFFERQESFELVELSRVIVDKAITFAYLPPMILTDLYNLLENNKENVILNKLLVGVESIEDYVLEDYFKLNPDMKILNGYGPTEATICSTAYVYQSHQSSGKIVPIGGPLFNTQVYILNQDDQLVPTGVLGEICVAGDQVARGYVDNEELNQVSFVSNPVNPKQRIYRTGDLARWRPDGVIEFFGRKDYQIKIRGFRIELSEVEFNIQTHPKVEKVVVLDLKNEVGNRHLVAYIVSKEKVTAVELKEYLLKKIPDYMVPTYFVQVPKIPLTISDKVDRAALLSIEIIMESQDTYVAPTNELEAMLVQIWEEELGVNNISITNNFFELGGHSIIMMKIISRINKELNLEVSPKDFVNLKTIQSLVSIINVNKQFCKQLYPSMLPDKENIYKPFPLTEVQMAYLMGRDQSFELGGISTHGYAEIEVEVDIQRFNETLNQIIRRHSMLHTVIMESGVQQILLEVPEYQVPVVDITQQEYTDKEAQILEARRTMSEHIFLIGQWPMFNFKAFKTGENLYYICFSFDPLVADASSVRTLIQEFVLLYTNPGVKLPELEFTFRDYMQAYTEFKKSETYAEDKKYWLSKLYGFPSAPALPLKKNPEEISNPHFNRLNKLLTQKEWKKIKDLAKENDISPVALLGTAYAEVLAFWSNQPHLAINMTVFNRYPFHNDVNKIVGDFTSTMLLDVNLEEEKTFWGRASRVQNRILDALSHRHYDGVEFVRELSIYNNLGTKAVMPIVFTSVLAESDEIQEWFDPSKIKAMRTRTSQVHIDYQAVEMNHHLSITWDYVEDIFEPEVIEGMFQQYVSMLKGLLESNEKESGISQEVRFLIEEFNNTDEDIFSTTLGQLFRDQVVRTPDNIAVTFNGESITYKELNERSNQIAHYLIEQNIGVGCFVGILAERTISTIVNLIGIVKSGAAYVPVDPIYPEGRRNFILENSKCIFLLEPDISENSKIDLYPVNDIAERSSFDDIAYVIYTSGSTGRPKGVVISHKAVTNTIIDINQKFDVNEDDRIMGLSSMCFDLSVYDIFGALSTGATLVLIHDQRDVELIKQTLEREHITIWNSVPAIMDMYLQHKSISIEEASGYWASPGSIADFEANTSLRLVLLSGDWIPLNLPEQIIQEFNFAEVISLGGATEGSIWSIYYPIKEVKPKWKSIPYGRPLANQNFYVLNYEQDFCPIGVQGELYIGGRGVAEGYMNDEEKTKKSFIHHPTLGNIYRTGDYGALCKEGYIEFLGRKDHQVKIRGYRIELGEIQSYLLEYEQIKNAVVIDGVDESKQKYLCAYYIADRELPVLELREYLLHMLPEYMVPMYFIKIDKIPLTSNGKIDRVSLPKPVNTLRQFEEYEGPRNAIEAKLIQICSSELENERIGIHDTFFELGINSLMMMRIKTKLTNEFNVEISFRDFIEANTIVHLANVISRKEKLVQEVCYPQVVPDKEKLHKAFSVTDVQMAYLIGRDANYEMGGTSTHGYSELETKLDIVRFNQSLQKLIEHQPMLRAVVYSNGTQKILEQVPEYQIDYEDIRHLNSEEQQQIILNERDRMSHHIFKTDEWPLFEFKAFKLSDETNYLLIGIDLLIADGASMHILVKELISYYNQPDILEEKLDFSFRDYIIALKEFKKSETYKIDKQYWMAKVADFPSAPALPYRMSSENIKNPHFKRHHKVFSGEEWSQLQKVAQQRNITPSALICTAYAQTLAFWSNQPHLAINSTVFTRYPFHPDVEKLVGDFTSVMLLDLNFIEKDSFWKKASHVQQVMMEALEHRHYDGIEFIREISRYNNLGTKAVMPIVFTSMLFNSSEKNQQIWSELGTIKSAVSQTSQVYLDHQVMEANGELSLTWDYVDELFEPEVIDRMFSDYVGILSSLLSSEQAYVPRISKEVEEFVHGYNNTEEEIFPTTLGQLFREQVKKTPEKIAVTLDGQGITYKELDERSNQVARYLIEQRVGSNQFVGILTRRIVETIINLLGIVKSGAAYVPIDPSYPEGRRNYILENSNCKLMLAPELYEEMNLNQYSTGQIDERNLSDDIAYVIYTSGSTGRPKGVVITHSAVTNTIIDINQKFNVTEKDKIIGLSSMCFDLSVYDIFGALSTGATLVLVHDQKDVEHIKKTIEKEQITIWNSVPAIMDMILESLSIQEEEIDYWSGIGQQVSFEKNSSLRLILLSGDWIPLNLPEKIVYKFNNAEVISLGGATEGSIWSIYYPIQEIKDEWRSIPYGVPMANQKFYVLNYEQDFCPIGVQGELYIAGRGVALGYQNDEDKTKNSFIHHPMLGYIYRTGDYGLLHKEGYMEFLGRKDHQVKIRGYRIELGEIQSCLLEHEDVKNAVVIDQAHSNGKKYLCAYLVTDIIILPGEYKEYLAKQLPDYMIPQYFVKVDHIPLTPNGKVDRKALPQPEDHIELEETYVAPRNELEARLTQIWQNKIGIGRVGIHDNFLEIGGNSIQMVQIVAKISAEFKIDINYKDFIERDTVAKLAEFIVSNQEQGSTRIYPTLEPDFDNLYEPFPLTEIQLAYLMGRGEEFEMGGVSTHGYSEVETELDIQLLNQSFQKVIDRHPMLRTIVLPNGMQQVLRDVPNYQIEVKDISTLSKEEQQSLILKERERMSHYVFMTDEWPLFEVKAFKISPTRHYVFMGFDLIITDGASMLIMGKELMDFYHNPDLVMLPLEFSFRDYVIGYKEFKKSETYKEDKKYWLRKLDEFPDAPQLPLVKNPGMVTKPHFERFTKIFAKEEYVQIKELAQENGVTLSALLCTTFGKVLAYWSNQPHLAINMTVFNRIPFHEDVNKIVGDFTSVMLLDLNYTQHAQYLPMVKSVQNTIMEALQHRHYDGVEFIREIARYKNYGTKAVMPIVFTSMLLGDENSNSDDRYCLGEEKMRVSQTSQVYLDHQLMETNGELVLTWDYVSELFAPEVIKCMFEQYIRMITHYIKTGHELKLELSDCQKRVVFNYNETDEHITPTTLHQLFIEQAQRTPEKIAVVFEGSSLTYRELDERSNQVARYLRECGIGRQDFVGILTTRCLETIINLFGLIKSGAAYVPVDPIYPEERRKYILENSNCQVMLEPSLFKEKNLADYSIDDVEVVNEIDDIAYIIYTSGSTGRPKGVVISHKAVTNTIIDINTKFNVNEEDKIIGLSSMCFDLSVYDIFGALSCGATLVLIKDQRDINHIIETLEKYQITIWNSVPAIMDMMLTAMDYKYSQKNDTGYWHSHSFSEIINYYVVDSLRVVLLSGDWIPLSMPEKIIQRFPYADVTSLGGATEASIWSIFYPINEIREDWKSIPYGTPLANQKFYVLNYEKEYCPLGVIGELFIGGIGVAKGYMKDEVKTRRSFINHPEFGYIYSTGDYGIMHEEGYIEFLGRKDNQVKIQGYRIELGEVEKCILELKMVQNVVVIDQQDNLGRKYLSGYVVIEGELDQQTIKESLANRLPDYMIPTYFVPIDHIPLNSNGKVDRKALQGLEFEQIAATEECMAPQTETEAHLLEMWKDILGISEIGVNTNLLDIGASSSNIIVFISRVQSRFNVKLPIISLFKNPTIQQSAELIDMGDLKSEVNMMGDCMVFNEGKDKKLFAFPPILSLGYVYKMLADELNDYSVYAFNFIEKEQVVNEYVRMIIQIQNKGPYILLGHSAGGNMAYEVAKELSTRGYVVSDIIMIDSYYVENDDDKPVNVEERRQYTNQVVELLVESYPDLNTSSEQIRDYIGKKIENYFKFLTEVRITNQIDVNIHFIKSIGDIELKQSMRADMDKWAERTSRKFLKYQGFGKHDNMLLADCVKKNAVLIRDILLK